MSAPAQSTPTLHKGIVKQVLSGDCVIIRGAPKGGPPPEKQLTLSNITAPKLARRPTEPGSETKDEPYAWESREFLRKKLIGKEVSFTIDYKPAGSTREYGQLILNGENVIESLISEGLVEVRTTGSSNQNLIQLQDAARAAGKGKWSSSSPSESHVRDIKWSVENPRSLVDQFRGKPVKAVVEHVRDGSTIRVFLLPSFHYVTLMISGIKSPGVRLGDDGKVAEKEPFSDESKFFTEVRLLQRDVEVVLESVSNQNFIGSVIHPNGDIAELLLREGFAKCVDWSMPVVTGGAEPLRTAERQAKDRRLRIWRNYEPQTTTNGAGKSTFTAKVIEVVMGDALVLKKESGETKKVWLSSVRPPRSDTNDATQQPVGRSFRPLYDIPHMFEAREFLRKKLIGKKVTVNVDYVQPAGDKFSERTCVTVTFGGQNVAEALIAKGLASVVRYKQGDENRSAHYDQLLAAEAKAEKDKKGLHGDKTSSLKIQELIGDVSKSRQFLPYLQRAGKVEGVVEFVASGSRLRIYVPKETCLFTLLLSGISCPRAKGPDNQPGEAFGDEALQLTKELCHQREVELEVEAVDKVGNFVGYLIVDGQNLAVKLVEEGLAKVHFTAERGKHFSALTEAEERAKKARKNLWKDFKEEEEGADEELSVDGQGQTHQPLQPQQQQGNKQEKKLVVLSEVVESEDDDAIRFFVQHCENGPKLEQMMREMREELEGSVVVGSYTPKRGDLCAARFVDGLWYRAKIETNKSRDAVGIVYVDFGNKETTSAVRLTQLPPKYAQIPEGAKEYRLAFVKLPKGEDHKEILDTFKKELADAELWLQMEYRLGGAVYATLTRKDTGVDVGKSLVEDGLLLADVRRERRAAGLGSEYLRAQEEAKRARKNIWRYGDFTGDDL